MSPGRFDRNQLATNVVFCTECKLCWLAFACQILTLEKVFIFCYGIGGKTWKEAMTAEYSFSNSEDQSARGSQGKK